MKNNSFVFRRVLEGCTSRTVTRAEGLSALAVAAEAAPNTSTGSIRWDFDIGPANRAVWPTRPRKSFVPRRRPFKVARSRPQTVSVRRWLVPRAASTSLASPSCGDKSSARLAGPFKAIGVGSNGAWRRRRDQRPRFHVSSMARVPGVPQLGGGLRRSGRASLLCHGDLPVRQLSSIFSAARLLRLS